MAGDDQPSKKVVAAGEASKGKAVVIEVESSETDEEISDSIPPKSPGGATLVVPSGKLESASSIKIPPIKKSKVDNADLSAAASDAAVDPPPPAVAPVPQPHVPCPICDRVFESFPAMFGHQRVHKERGYRGAYPPPTFTKDEAPPSTRSAEDNEEAARIAAQMLIDMSKGKFEKPNPIIVVSEPGEGTSSGTARGIDVDLNVPLDTEKAGDSEEEKKDKGKGQLDLNRTPSSDDLQVPFASGLKHNQQAEYIRIAVQELQVPGPNQKGLAFCRLAQLQQLQPTNLRFHFSNLSGEHETINGVEAMPQDTLK